MRKVKETKESYLPMLVSIRKDYPDQHLPWARFSKKRLRSSTILSKRRPVGAFPLLDKL